MTSLAISKTAEVWIIVGIVILVLILLGIVLYFPLKRFYVKRHFRRVFSRKIYQIATYQDYYLINDFVFKYDDTHGTVIDHVLFGNKYIYLIIDRFFDGSLTGREDDASLILIKDKKAPAYTDNPIRDTKQMIKRLSSSIDVDEKILIGISVINSECSIDVIQNNKVNYIIQINKLGKLIEAIESRQIGNLNQNQLASLVNDFDRLNKRNKKKNGSK